MTEKQWQALTTRIGWCHATLNLWTGCAKISPGCANCYAKTWAKRTGRPQIWGEGAARPEVQGWRRKIEKLRKMARDPEARKWLGLGDRERLRVFIGSLMDWAEGRDDTNGILAHVWPAIRDAVELDFLMLTKRPANIFRLLPVDWSIEAYPNVWPMTSIESGAPVAKCRITKRPVRDRLAELVRVPAAVHAISYEPAVGPLADWCEDEGRREFSGLDWVIYGGESGPGFRPEGEPGDPKAWAREMRTLCDDAGVYFFHKQGAAFRNETGQELDGEIVQEVPPSVNFQEPYG